jgi:FkbM family methyltransferase
MTDVVPFRRVALLDIGARGGLQWPWTEWQSEWLSPTFVEPDTQEAARLREVAATNSVIEVALYSAPENLSLNLNASPGTSSVFAPNHSFLQSFPESSRFCTKQSIPLKATTVNMLAQTGALAETDFAKIDVQGAELAILKGGEAYFRKNLIGLEVEVGFAPIYTGQPFFSEVDTYIREELGLELWDIRGTYWRHKAGLDAEGPIKGQMIFGDALYFRPLSTLVAWLNEHTPNEAQGKLYALVMAVAAYGYNDYALTLLRAEEMRDFWAGQDKAALEEYILGRSRFFRFPQNGSGKLYRVFSFLAAIFRPSHNRWAVGDERLGSRKVGPFWF